MLKGKEYLRRGGKQTISQALGDSKRTKMIDGKRYSRVMSSTTKASATKKAQELRTKGRSVRVLSSGQRAFPYGVYVRG